jgi:class 3 adenylate cyclase
MTEALKGFNLNRKQNGKFSVSNGFGIAHGELLMGTMGNLEGRRDFTVTGKTVNVAAEMEKMSKIAGKFPIVLCPVSAKIVCGNGINSSRLNHEREAYEIL